MYKKNILFVALMSILLVGCKTIVSTNENSCKINNSEDKITITNNVENYELSVYLYGNEIKIGEYQVFGSDLEPLLEGTLQKKDYSGDIKTTLFVKYNGEVIELSGTAYLYKNGKKTGETFEFSYVGALIK